MSRYVPAAHSCFNVYSTDDMILSILSFVTLIAVCYGLDVKCHPKAPVLGGLFEKLLAPESYDLISGFLTWCGGGK